MTLSILYDTYTVTLNDLASWGTKLAGRGFLMNYSGLGTVGDESGCENLTQSAAQLEKERR